MARGVLVSRNHCVQAVAPDAAVRRCPPPARLGRAIAECGRHMARSSRAIASRRLQHSMLPIGAVLRQLGWGERLQCADGTWCARLARSRRAGGGTRCCRAALSSASSAGSATAERGRRVASLSRTIATRRRQHPMLPCGVTLCQHIWEGACRAYTAHGVLVSRDCDAQAFALSASCGTALRQLGWGGCVESADGACQWRDHLARSRHASGGTWCCLAALPSASTAGESDCRERKTHGVLVSRDRDASGEHSLLPCGAALRQLGWESRCSCRARTALGVFVSRDSDAPAAASEASVRRCASQAQPGRAPAERRRHVACLSRATAKRRLQHLTQPCGTALRQLGWGESLQSADDTARARLALSRRAGSGTRCRSAMLPSTSAAGEDDCRAWTTRGVLVSRDREAPAAAPDAAMLHCPPPARLGRATAEH
jgi:hypothetical protein